MNQFLCKMMRKLSQKVHLNTEVTFWDQKVTRKQCEIFVN